MTTEIRTFNALDHVGIDQTIRVVELNGEPWFVAVDIYPALGLKQWGGVLNPLDDSEKTKRGRTSVGLSPGRDLWLISESGLYKLVMRCDKPQAKAFQDWVTKVVLPAIRKDGAYVMGEEKVVSGEMSEDELVMRALDIMRRKVERLQAERDGAVKIIGKHDHTINRVARMFDGVNTQATKKDLCRLGYLYHRFSHYRVRRHFSHLFVEKLDEATGKGNIYCTPEGKAELARLYEEGKLTMKVGYQAA